MSAMLQSRGVTARSLVRSLARSGTHVQTTLALALLGPLFAPLSRFLRRVSLNRDINFGDSRVPARQILSSPVSRAAVNLATGERGEGSAGDAAEDARLLKNFGTASGVVRATVIPVPLAQYLVIRNYVCSLTCPPNLRAPSASGGSSREGRKRGNSRAGGDPPKLERLNSRRSARKLPRLNYHLNSPSRLARPDRPRVIPPRDQSRRLASYFRLRFPQDERR
jgi:hypothetical protein